MWTQNYVVSWTLSSTVTSTWSDHIQTSKQPKCHTNRMDKMYQPLSPSHLNLRLSFIYIPLVRDFVILSPLKGDREPSSIKISQLHYALFSRGR